MLVEDAATCIAAIFDGTDQSRLSLQALNARIRQLVEAGALDGRDAHLIFATLGPPEPPGGLPLPPGNWSIGRV